MQCSIEDKQKFLRSQILEGGLDPESFMAFMGTIKDQGESINLQNWTLQQVNNVVKDFKKSLNEQIQREQQLINYEAKRGSKQMMTSKIMQKLQKKQKVFYDYNDQWDYQLHAEQQCKKLNKYFEFKVNPQIDYKSWDIKRTGGFIFGMIGSTNQLEITFITNFTEAIVTRKAEDIDWLRLTLAGKFPGSFIPPLEPIRAVQPEDKSGIMRRVKQTIFFLNSLLEFDYLIQNKYFHIFMTEQDQKKFLSFKARENAVKINADIGSIQTIDGKFSVQISQRVINFVKDSSSYANYADQTYKSIQNNIRKVLGDLQTLAKHSHYIANDFAKLHEKHTKMTDKCKINGNNNHPEQLSNILIYLNNMFTTIGNQQKKNMSMLRQFSDEFVRYTHSQWTQFIVHHRKYQNQFNNYLTLKYNLQRKMQRSYSDVSKWQLDDRQQFRMSRVNVANMDKEEAYEIMLPKQRKVEQQTRIWQAYVNYMYEKSYRILINEQQKLYLRHCGKYCVKMDKVLLQQAEVYQRFGELFQNKYINAK